MLFATKIDKITYLSTQDSVTTKSSAKTVRLDVLVKDGVGTSYNIEMQVGNEYNIPKRMRYYQAMLDVAFLDKGYSYKNLNNSIIIFVCLFDPIGKGRAVYTFENTCTEDKTIFLQDGIKKVILNSKAFQETDDKELGYTKPEEDETGLCHYIALAMLLQYAEFFYSKDVFSDKQIEKYITKRTKMLYPEYYPE